jgi:hypothetical protein
VCSSDLNRKKFIIALQTREPQLNNLRVESLKGPEDIFDDTILLFSAICQGVTLAEKLGDGCYSLSLDFQII